MERKPTVVFICPYASSILMTFFFLLQHVSIQYVWVRGAIVSVNFLPKTQHSDTGSYRARIMRAGQRL